MQKLGPNSVTVFMLGTVRISPLYLVQEDAAGAETHVPREKR